jgi:acetyl-CoA C-acetyltransferase
MSRVPYLLEARWGYRMGNQPLIDSMYRDGFLCQISKMVMGDTAEVLAGQYQISREEQDKYAMESHRRAARAASAGDFNAEIVPIERTDKKGKVTRMDSDEHIRGDVTLEALAKLPPVFAPATGATATVTAGSSSGITDGAAAIVLVSEEKLRSLKLTPLARIVDAAVAGVDPRVMGIGPVPASRITRRWSSTKLLRRKLSPATANYASIVPGSILTAGRSRWAIPLAAPGLGSWPPWSTTCTKRMRLKELETR